MFTPEELKQLMVSPIPENIRAVSKIETRVLALLKEGKNTYTALLEAGIPSPRWRLFRMVQSGLVFKTGSQKTSRWHVMPAKQGENHA